MIEAQVGYVIHWLKFMSRQNIGVMEMALNHSSISSLTFVTA